MIKIPTFLEPPKILLTLMILALPLSAVRAANLVLNANDAAGASSFNSGLHWSDGNPPAAGNSYQTVNFLLRTPANATAISFLGDSLEVQAGGSLRDKTANTVTIANLIITNTGVLELTQPNGVNTAAAAGTLAGNITLNGTAVFHAGINTDAAGETFTISAAISGTGGFTTTGSNGKIILSSANIFSGGATSAGLAGSTVQLGNANAVSNGTVTVSLTNGLTFSSGITTFNLGGLAGANNFALTDLAAAAVTLNIGGNNSTTTYTGAMSGSGAITKVGNGTLTLNNTNSYSGVTTVSAGRLIVGSNQRTTNSVSVSNVATFGITVLDTNQFSPAAITFGSSSTTNEFYSVSSTTIAPFRPGTLTLNGVTVIRVVTGTFAAGNSYPLINYTTLSGAGSLVLGALPGGVSGNLSTSGNTVYLNVTSVSPSIWTGSVNGNWDIGTTANWSVNGVGSTYVEGADTRFDDSGNNTAINVAATVSPTSVTVSNSTKTYTFSGSSIAGLGGLVKIGTGAFILNNSNTYAGSTIVSNGTLQLGTNNALPSGAGKGDLMISGGVLDLNSRNQIINGLSGVGVVDTLSGGTPLLSVGNNNASSSFSGIIKNSAGALALTKVGSGTLTLGNTNNYAGQTRIEGGTLILAGSSGASRFVLTNSGTTLRFSSNFTSTQGISISTSAADINETILVDTNAQAVVQGLSDGVDAQSTWFSGGGTLILTNATTTYDGRLRLNGLTLVIDNASLTQTSPNIQAAQIGSGAVPGIAIGATGVLTVRGNGQYTLTTQGLRIGSDANGATGILNVQNNGSVNVPFIYLPRQSGNTGMVNQVGGTVTTPLINGGGAGAWLGAYNLNGGIFAWGGGFANGPTAAGQAMYLNLNGGTLQFSQAAGAVGGWTAINVNSNGAVIDTMANPVTFIDALVAGDAFNGGLTKLGSDTLTLSGTNTYAGNTVVSNGTLALSLPSGGITGIANSPLIRLESGTTFDVNAVAAGYHVVSGQTLRGNGTVSGAITVDSGGTLTIGGATGTPGTLAFNNTLTLNGNTILRINKSGTSDQLTGISSLAAGGTLTLANVGPSLANGDSFTLFPGLASATGGFIISPLSPGPGLAWDQSQLSSGIIAVTLAPTAPNLFPPLQDQTAECGTNVTFTAAATGAAPLYFQWSTNGLPATGWTTNNPNTFMLTNVHATESISVVVTNSVGNANSSATLTVQDTTAPVVTMLGANPMTVIVASTFVDPGATANDACEGALAVTTNSTVDMSQLGSYTVTYSATDSQSHSASAIRTVNVVVNSAVWTNQAGGLWNTAANWTNGGVAGDNATVADFNSIDITNDVTVSLNGSRKVAGLIFGDTAPATPAGWTLNNNGNNANVLTLERYDGSLPVITVNALGTNKSVTISALISTTNGLTKTGNGTLVLSAPNSYSNTTIVAGGTLLVSGSNTNINTTLALTNANTVLRFASNANYTMSDGITFTPATGNNGEIVTVDGGAQVLLHTLAGGNNASDTWFNGGGTIILTNGSTTYDGRLRVNNLTLIIDKDAILTQTGANVASSQIGSGLVPNAPAGNTAIMTVRANGQFIQNAQGLRLGSDGNGTIGILNVQNQGSVTVPLIYLPRQSGNTGVVNQAGGTVTTASIQGGGAGTWQGTYNLNGGTLAWGGGFATGPTAAGQTMLLNLNGGVLQFTADATVAGWSAVNVLSGGAFIDTANTVNFTQPLVAGDAFGGGLTKTGSGLLVLSGANTYYGNTTVNGGTLELAQPTLAAISKVSVTNGAVLQLDFAVTNTVATLVVNGVTKSPGVYNNGTDPLYLTGTGSLQVAATVATNPTNITFTVSGSALILDWPADHTGWHLQAQTNSLSTGLGTNWVTIPNTDLGHSYTNTINPANGAVFYRLILP